MIKRFTNNISFTLLVMVLALMVSGQVSAQDKGVTITGTVFESGTNKPLEMVSVSVAATGLSTSTNNKGEFTINVPVQKAELIFNLPGYVKRTLYTSTKNTIKLTLVKLEYKSVDKELITPLDKFTIRDAGYANTSLESSDMELSSVTSFDQILSGKVAGLTITDKSGMPGQRTYMNIRGISSLYGSNEPVIFIDGMIHDYSYAKNSIIEGFSLNPLDVLDIDDIMDITVMKGGASFIGSAGSNGIINVNTEQEGETSTRIKFSTYGGISTEPNQLDVLNANQFNNFFEKSWLSDGLSNAQIDGRYPWLNGGTDAVDYYKYNNNTNWQEEIFSPSLLQKYHFFLKGGDDIATYNISTGYLKHGAIYDDSGYSRFNLRVNGKVNITNKLSLQPNVKLSLATSKTPNQGSSYWKNPIMSALLKPSIMAPYARDASAGIDLPYLDDVGNVFPISNPVAIVNNAIGTNVNYVFMSSIKANYQFSDQLSLSTLVGMDFNNSHEDIFLPDLGMAQVDLAHNSPGYFVNEFQSTQNHTSLSFRNKTDEGHNYVLNAGFRYMQNNYKYNYALDLNTASDEIKSLGRGGSLSYLREVGGDERGLVWTSYFTNVSYNFRNKYYLDANVSLDGSSALEGDNRYNIFPSLAAAWQPVSAFKLRTSYSVTGNMFSDIYDHSRMYYTSQRLNNTGVVVREAIPNSNMEIERKTTLNVGADLSLFNQQFNMHVDAFQANVDNLLMYQVLPMHRGYTDYVDNGGKLQSTGIELGLDGRVHLGSAVWTIGLTAAKQQSILQDATYLNSSTDKVVTEFVGGEMVTSKGNSVNSFYGYKTDGLYSDATEASAVIGPNGFPMQVGDVRYVGGGDGVINEDDKMIIGDPNPDFFGGIFTSLTYNKLKLTAQFNYSVGNDAYNYVRSYTEGLSYPVNQSTTVLDRWGVAGNATLPQFSMSDPRGNTVFSDRWIEDASYLRLKQLTLSYDLPNFFGFRGLTVYTTATNLITLTKYSGYDPEFQYGNNPFYSGVDYGQMPHSKKFIVGLKLDL